MENYNYKMFHALLSFNTACHTSYSCYYQKKICITSVKFPTNEFFSAASVDLQLVARSQYLEYL